MKFDLLYRRRWWLLNIPIVAFAALLLWISSTVWLPQPPKSIIISAGQAGDGTTQIALRYRQALAQLGIAAQVVTQTQAHDSLKALRSNPPAASLAIASGLHAAGQPLLSGSSASSLQSLAVIEREPLWVFSRSPLLTRMQDLRGLRIGIAANDLLAEQSAQLLLAHSQLSAKDTPLLKVSRDAIANQLIDGQLDVVIVQASASSDVVRMLTRSAAVQIIGLDQVRSLVLREPRLRPFVLPQGVIELRGDIPSRDLTMVAADLQLVIDSNMHPAMQRALLDVAEQLHERPSFLQRQGEFPRTTEMDFPASPVAINAKRGGKPWLEQFLPYGWAQLAQWVLLAFLPIVLGAIFLLGVNDFR